MQTLTDVQNPYWDIVRTVPGDEIALKYDHRWEPTHYTPGPEGVGKSRHELVVRYSWAIPSTEAVDWLVTYLAGRPVVEIGAGTGYWAWLLNQAGVDVAAYDEAPPTGARNHWHCPKEGRKPSGPGVEWTPVKRGSHRHLYLPDNRHRVLFLSWPPYDDPMGAQVLSAYRGDTVVYIGEGPGGCTGNDDMFTALSRSWEVDAECDAHVSWWGIHDSMTAYRRTRPLRPNLP